jgi:pyruvate dehydrogenase E1 component alpha subunit
MADPIAIYEHAVRARLLDDRLTQLARADVVGFHPEARPFELATVAATLALDPTTAIFPTARDHLVLQVRGLSLSAYLAHVFGTAEDAALGRANPGLLGSRSLGIVPSSGLVGNHLTHALGFAWGALLAGGKESALALFGEATVNSAEFHAALNFAGVSKAPVVFLARVDAASTSPRVTESVLDKVVAYGVESASAEADDPEGVARAVRAALDSRKPTLLEVRYAAREDPLDVYRVRLIERGAWSASADLELKRTVMGQIEAEVARARAASPAASSSMLEHVFASPRSLTETSR